MEEMQKKIMTMNKYLEKKPNEEYSALHALAVCSSVEAINAGCFYELDHSKLPPQAPELLKSIRIVKVSIKNSLKVSVTFPSIRSLQAFLSEDGSVKNQYPEMDEEYLLKPETAADVLYRRVPADKVEWWNDWSFWSMNRLSNSVQWATRKARTSQLPVDNFGGLVGWGSRKRFRFVKPERSLLQWGVRKPRTPKSSERKRQPKSYSWTPMRLEMAEENMLKVLKASGATVGKPIKRKELRAKARKLIRQNALLDHLLKHMAGKVAPGGSERFQGRPDPDKGWVYWLESADLVAVKEAGRDKESRQLEEGLTIVNTTSNSLVTSMDQACSPVNHELKDKYIDEYMQQASQTWSGMKEENMHYSDVPQLTDNDRGLKEDKPTKQERQFDQSAVPTTASVTFSTKPATTLELILPHDPNSSSSSGSLVKPFAERCPINTSTLLSNVINPPYFSPAFTRAPSEIKKTTSLSQSGKTFQINLNENPGDAQHNKSTAISGTRMTCQRRHQLMKANSASASKNSMNLRGHSKSEQHHEYHLQTC